MKLEQRRGWVTGNGFNHRIDGWELAWDAKFVWAKHLCLLPIARLLYDIKGPYPFQYDGPLGLLPRMKRVNKYHYLMAFVFAARTAVLEIVVALLMLMVKQEDVNR